MSKELCEKIGGIDTERIIYGEKKTFCTLKESWLRGISTDCESLKGTLDEKFSRRLTDKEASKKLLLCSLNLDELSSILSEEQKIKLEKRFEGTKELRKQAEEQAKKELERMHKHRHAYNPKLYSYLQKWEFWSRIP